MIQNHIFPKTQFDPSGRYHVPYWEGVPGVNILEHIYRGAKLENITPIQDGSPAKAGFGASVILGTHWMKSYKNVHPICKANFLVSDFQCVIKKILCGL